jgi:group I intron endonuclease
MPTVYLIRNTVNGKGYVGKTEKTVAQRFSGHKKDSKAGSKYALHRAMRKYRIESFTVVEVASCDLPLLNDLEKHYIRFYGTFAPTGHGYNMTTGGEGQSGLVCSEETKSKLRTANLGKKNGPPSVFTRGKISAALTGIKRGPHSDEWEAKIGSRIQREEEKRKRANSLRGHIVSVKTRAQLSASNRGQRRSDETKRNLSTAHIGKTHTPEQRAKMTESQKLRWEALSPDVRAERAARKIGKKMPPRSQEWRTKQSTIQSGKPWSIARRSAQLRKVV